MIVTSTALATKSKREGRCTDAGSTKCPGGDGNHVFITYLVLDTEDMGDGRERERFDGLGGSCMHGLQKMHIWQ